MTDLILADAFEGFGIVVFLVISFISWILNMKKQGEKPANRPRPNNPPQAQGAKRPAALKNELEMFLEEVTGEKKKPRPQQPRRAKPRPDGPRPKPAAAQQQRPRPSRQRVPQPSRPKPARPVEPQPTARRELGSKLRDHVDDYMGENRVDKHVEEHLAEGVSGRKSKRIGSSVKQHLGSSISGTPVQIEVDELSPTTANLMKMLRDPTSVKNAILINEILQPPRALRR